jgi:type VI secretion system protein ImpM
MTPPFDVGFYGKLPSHGDFLRRRASDGFVAVWDAWLQDGLSASRAALGDAWLDVYLTSPVWRFTASAGVGGQSPIAGVMVPSVDRVGRYFPLTLVAELPHDVDLLAVSAAADPVFESAERLVIDTLEAEDIDFEAFNERAQELADVLEPLCVPPRLVLDPAAASLLESGEHDGVQIPIGSSPQIAPVLLQAMSQRLAALYDPLMIWWTTGSAMVEPSCLVSRGLPAPESFVALLDGSWADRRWHVIPATSAAGADDTLVAEGPPLVFSSAAASDVGRVRTVNQDAFVERPEVGIWVVADGLGGHSDGEVASRMVCDAFAELMPDSSFEELIETARERMQEVNDQLNRVAERSLLGVRCGSTVVALLARGSRLAVVWAGDSRMYRWRGGRLEQLTRDHSLAASDEADGSEPANVITRAVGGDDTLLLDVRRDEVRPGDRFLLCSDGLTRTLPDERIEAWMAQEDVRAAVSGLIADTLEAGAPDNVTVLLVDARV